MSKHTQEYLLVGSVPDLVASFIKNSGVTPVIELDKTTYLVVGEDKPLRDRMNMVANMYTREEVKERGGDIAGVYGEKTKLAIQTWVKTL